jgi:predicted CopG family antitoxin
MKSESYDDHVIKVKEIYADMTNLKQSLDSLKDVEQSSSSEMVREILHRKRMDLIQTRELLNATLEHINYERAQGMRSYHD